MNRSKWIGVTAAIVLMVIFGTINCKRTPPVNGPDCGIAHVEARKSSNRIAGRQKARPGSWPWMVTVHRRPDGEPAYCTGTVLSDKFILTAAQCVGRDMQIVAGEHTLDLPEKSEQKRNVARAIRHYKNGQLIALYDIALLKLDEPLEFNERVAPICIAEEGAKLELGQSTNITGWSHTKRQNPDEKHRENVQQQGVVSIVDNFKCGDFLPGEMEQEIICAGGENDSQNACLGDPGGPLMAKENRHYVQYGIRSSDARDPYCMYTKVSHFRNWIDETIESMMQSG